MNYCLGTVQFGIDYGIQGNSHPNINAVFDMLNYATEQGIDMMDTASAYGSAETILGKFFKKYSNVSHRTGVISKLNPDAFEQAERDRWVEIALKSAQESLDRLCINKFYAYLFHNAKYIFDEGAVDALNEVKCAGLAEEIGVSIYTPEEALRSLDYSDIGVIQIPYNLFDHRLDKCFFFEKAREKGVKVFARSSLLQGLAVMDPNHLPKRVYFAKEYLERFIKICKDFCIAPLSAAIGYVGSKRGIDYIVFGVDSIVQLKEYLALKESVLPEEMICEIDKVFENTEAKLVNPVLW